MDSRRVSRHVVALHVVALSVLLAPLSMNVQFEVFSRRSSLVMV